MPLDPIYPKCKYSDKESAVVVKNADEEAALGPGWYDHPTNRSAAKAPEPPPPPQKVAQPLIPDKK